jgi:hypothetical protein
MSSPTVTRRNNLNSPLQVQDGNRTVDELRDERRQFGEAGGATRSELLQSEAQYLQAAQLRIELAKGQLRAANVGQGQAATKFSQPSIDSQDRINAEHLQRMEADRVEKRRQREAAAERQKEADESANAARPASLLSSSTAESTRVMDMRFCISNLDSIRREAGDFTLKEFSDYWAPDNEKTAPNLPSTFVPTRMVRGSYPLWAPFYDPGRTRLGDDGAEESDPDHPPHFRVSCELLGRMLHTFKKGYVDEDEKKKTSVLLSHHIQFKTARLTENVSKAAERLQRRKENLHKQHDEVIAASQQHILESTRAYKEAIDKHMDALQMSLQGTNVLAQGFKEEARNLKETIVSSNIVPSLKLDDKELGYVKQLKELQREHSVLQLEHKRLQDSTERAVKHLNTAREINGETSQVIADLQGRNKSLGQDKLGLELLQVKLKKEVETLKRKRRGTPSLPPAKPADTPTLRILNRGEKESPAVKETTLSPSSLPPNKKFRNRSKRWDQPAPGQGRKVPSPARTPDNVNGKRMEGQNIKDDPVLHASLHSFRNKKDVEEEIRRSSKSLIGAWQQRWRESVPSPDHCRSA